MNSATSQAQPSVAIAARISACAAASRRSTRCTPTGVRVALGLDEAGINDRDILQEMQLALRVHRVPGLVEDEVPSCAETFVGRDVDRDRHALLPRIYRRARSWVRWSSSLRSSAARVSIKPSLVTP